MSFRLSAINLPSGAIWWIPVIYVKVNAGYPYYPDYLPIPSSWVCPVNAGAGITCDFRCIVYDSIFRIMDMRDKYNVIVRDGAEYTYNWATDTFYEKAVTGWSVIGSDVSVTVTVPAEPPPPPEEWQVIGSDKEIVIRFSLPPPPPEWQIIGSDRELIIILAPEIVGWQIIGEDIEIPIKMILLNEFEKLKVVY